ncbi:MAG: Hsp20/alpha crystallin family protein [Desulfurococcales archaeon]|nr:Hsp20/alpha crystallin family protein [Desulfurococcales archaeon]
MSWWRRRRSIFDIFDEIMRDMEESFRFLEEEVDRLLRERRGEEKGPIYYGVRITIGPDGVPRVEEFGNVKRGRRGRPLITEEIEPLVDVIEHGDEVWVVAELPGVDKEKIKVKAQEKKLVIKAENGRKYYKEVDLPAKVDPKSARASYRNGVLEVKLKKVEEEGKGVDIKIE